MDEICRLCLSGHDSVHNLFEDSILTKVTSCLKLELTKEDCLPHLICEDCIKKVEDIYNFSKKVTENQNTLYTHMKNGLQSLNIFYSSLNNITEIKLMPVDETDENITKYLRKNLIDDENEFKIENGLLNKLNNSEETIKEEHLDNNYDYNESEDDKMSIEQIKNKSEKETDTGKNNPIKNKEAKETAYTARKPRNKDDLSQIEHYELKCLTCFAIYGSKKALAKHYLTVHRPIELADTENIKRVLIVEGRDKYRCGTCGRDFKTKKDAKRHLDSHNPSRPFLCNLCGRTYKDTHDIIRHIRAHSDARLHCSFGCGYTSAYASALRTHEKKHSGDFKYTCEKCGKGFHVKTWFDDHQNVHNGLKPHVCDVCGVAFHLKRYLSKHRNTAHPDAVSGLKRFVCLECSKPCDNKYALKEHMLVEHGIEVKFLCDVCGSTFNTSDHLRLHQITHLEVKPHHCSTCNRSFSTRFHLKRHQVSHSGDREYACHCGKRFSLKCSLKKHNMSKHCVTTTSKC